MNDSRNTDDAASDHSLLKRLRGGQSDDAATRLYMRYAKRLQALARAQTAPALASRFDPEDVVQSVFRTFFRRVADGMYDVPPGEQLWQLLLVLALNKVRALGAFHRAKKRDVKKTVSPDDIGKVEKSHEESPLQTLELVIEEILTDMKPLQRRMVEMRIEGYEISEIAAATKRSKRTAERVLQQFRKSLAELVDESGKD